MLKNIFFLQNKSFKFLMEMSILSLAMTVIHIKSFFQLFNVQKRKKKWTFYKFYKSQHKELSIPYEVLKWDKCNLDEQQHMTYYTVVL